MRGRNGFTLIEILITIVLAAVVMLAAYGVYISQTKGFVVLDQHTQSTQSARLALDQLSRELRMAGFGVLGTTTITDARASAITFLGDIDSDINGTLATAANSGSNSIQVDLNDDQDVVEAGDFVFLHSGSNVEMIRVTQTGDPMSLSGEPDTINLNSALTKSYPAATTLVKTVESTTYTLNFGTQTLTKNGVESSTGISNLEFHYFDESDNELTPASLQSLTAAERASVRRIDIVLQTRSAGDSATTRNYNATIDLRNMGARGFSNDTCAPSAPSSPVITDSATCGHFTVSWSAPTTNACDGSAVTDLGGYKIYFGTSSGNYYTPAFNVSAESATSYQVADIRLENSQMYYVAVAAYDSNFNESAKSGEAFFTLNDTARPGPPVSVDASASVGTVTLTWENPTDVDAESFRIYRGTTSDFTPSGTNMIADENSISTGQTTYIDATVTACQTHYYKISSIDCVGEGTYSTIAYGDGAGSGQDSPTTGVTNTTASESPPASPAAASPFGATGGSQAVNLAWTNPTDTDFNRAVIRYSTSFFPTSVASGSEVVVMACSPGTQSIYQHTGLTNGITYYYSLFTCDRCNNCENSSTAQASPNPMGPIVQIISPTQNQTISGGTLVFQARAYDPDEGNLSASPNVTTDNGKGITNISFAISPEIADGSLPSTDTYPEYCAFGGDANPCSAKNVTQWCPGAYNLYATALDNDGQTTQTDYTTINITGGTIERDTTYTNTVTGTYKQQLNFRLKNTASVSVKLKSITATWTRSQAMIGYVRIPTATTIWNYTTGGGPAGTGTQISIATASQPTITSGSTATVQFEFLHNFTTLTSASAIGATQVSVASVAGFAAGDVVIIGTTESKSVSSVVGNTLQFATGLASAHSSGDRVSTVANNSDMPMTGATVNMVITYQLASSAQDCATSLITASVAAGPVVGTPYQDKPNVDTPMSTTVNYVHVLNNRAVPVHVTVDDYSGLGITSMKAYYKVDTTRAATAPTSGYSNVTMTYSSTNARYEGTIPSNKNARVWVYFIATDGNNVTDRDPASGAYAYDYDADTTPPSCPLGLTATVLGLKSIGLMWMKSTEDDIAGYNIWRSVACAAYAKKYSLVTDQNTATPDVIDYTDNDTTIRTNAKCYKYYIVAQDTSGNLSTGCTSYLAQAGVCPCP